MGRIHCALIAALLLSGASGTVHAARKAAVEVEEVEAEGMKALGVQDLESVLEVAAGDPFDAVRARRSAENLRELYSYRGYPEARVAHEWDEKKGRLSFRVQEGKPVRIGDVRIFVDAGFTPEFSRYWSRYEPYLLGILNIGAGEVFDQERATATARLLQGALQEEEFIGSSVNEVRIQRLDRPPTEDAIGWVQLQIRIELGERVTFGFRGNQYFSRNDLLQQVQEQRALGLGRNYLETLRSRIEEFYQAAGFGQVAVEAFPQEMPEFRRRHVTFVVKEGPRGRIGAIEFDGNSAFSDPELLQIFMQGVPRMLSNGIHVQSELTKSVEFLVQKLKARGYLSARILSQQTLWNPARTRAVVQIYLNEGEQTRVGEVQVLEGSGPARLPVDVALGILGVRPGEPFNIFAFNEGIEQVKSWYRNRGFLEVSIAHEGTSGDSPDAVVQYREENRIAEIRLKIVPGPEFRLAGLRVEGLQKTRESVVVRELTLVPGQVLTEGALAEGESKLRKLGLFSSVQLAMEADPNRPDARWIIVQVQEGTPGLLAGGLGYRNDLGIRAFGTTSYGNLFGRNHTIAFTTTVNRRLEERRVPVEYQVQLGYVWPWFGLGDLSFRPNVTFQRIQYVNFDATSLALAATWEKKLLDSPNLVAALNYSLERTEQNAEDQSSIDNQTLTIGAITPSVRLDLRDNPLAPTRGFYGSLSYEIADPSLLAQVDPFPVGYTRLLFRSDYSWNLWRNLTWYFSFRTGLERNTQDITDIRVAIPLIKQFALGGAASLRGFKEQEINIQDIAVRGTASYVNYRTQLDLPIAGPLRVGPFLDAANLLVDDYSLRTGLRFGTGFGLHYLTPVGPVNFDLGFKVKPRPGEDNYRFYFSIGMI